MQYIIKNIIKFLLKFIRYMYTIKFIECRSSLIQYASQALAFLFTGYCFRGKMMKALSVKQPWACLLAEGIKKIEVRSWATEHRGDLLICASASPKNCFWHDPVDDVNRLLHAGCMIGIVNLIDVRKLTKADTELSHCDYEPGAYAWVVEPVSYVRPDKIIGKLRLFDVDDGLINKIANDETDWVFNYPPPQGEIKYTERCSIWA